jgi:hypothetical protein
MNMTKIYLLMAIAIALQLLTAGRQIAGAEPLPPLPFGNQGVPPDPSSFPSVVLPQDRNFQVNPNFTNPDFRDNSRNLDSKRYLVYIPGENPQTLAQVRLYEPEAFLSQYKGRTVIQVGVFTDRNNAQRLARELELGGVRSAIASIDQPATNVAPAWINPPVASGYNLPPVSNSQAMPPIGTSFSTLPAPPPGGGSQLARGYFLIVPGNRQDLPRMIQTAVDSGVSGAEIFTREEPFGPHIAIGPFRDRTTAQQESGYLQKFGLDARIHFQN